MLSQFSKMGGNTAFIGKVGNDLFGRYLCSILESNNINTDGLIVSSEYNTSLAFVDLDSSGEREFLFYRNKCADSELAFEEIDKALIQSAKIFHFGTVSMSCGESRNTTVKVIKFAKKVPCIISMDMNYRAHIWQNENEAYSVISEILPYVDILKLSEEELYLLTKQRDIEKAICVLHNTCNAALIFITCGGNGAYAFNDTNVMYYPAYKMNVIDTTGAGDAFYGAALYHLKDYTLAQMRKLDGDTLEKILMIATASGGLTTENYGGIPAIPSRSAIENFLKGK